MNYRTQKHKLGNTSNLKEKRIKKGGLSDEDNDYLQNQNQRFA